MPSCRESAQARAKSEWWELEAKRIELVHRVEVLEVRLSKVEAARQEQEDLKAERERIAKRHSTLEGQAQQLRREMAQQEVQLVELHAEWIRKTRNAVVGWTFDEFRGAHGRTYKQVVITRVTDVGVEFRHETGIARLAADDLSLKQQDFFALDSATSRDAIQQERQMASAFDVWVDQGAALAAERKAALEQAQLAAEAESSYASSQASSDAPVTSSGTSPLRQEARPFGNGGSIWYPYRSYYRTRYYYPSSYYYHSSCHYVPSPCRVSASCARVRVPTANWSVTW